MTKKNNNGNPFIRFIKMPYCYSVIFSVLLISVFSLILVDTFLVSEAIKPVEESGGNETHGISQQAETKSSETVDGETKVTESETTTEVLTEPIIRDDYYRDADIEISIETVRAYNTDVYVADVKISNAAYFKTAFAQDTYGRNIKAMTSEIADAHNAIFAVNGDYYGFRSTGWVLRNGALYRANGNDYSLLMDNSGNFSCERDFDIIDVLVPQLRQVWTFGPPLVMNGEISVTEWQEISGAHMTSNPRTAMGQRGELHYIFIVSDGRTSTSAGLSLHQLATLFAERGCETAYNLDGGGSATMYFNGQLVNKPTANGKDFVERRVSDIVYIGY